MIEVRQVDHPVIRAEVKSHGLEAEGFIQIQIDMTGQAEINPFQHLQLRRLRADERQRQVGELAVNLRALEFPVIIAERDKRDRLVADLDGAARLPAEAVFLPPDKDIGAGHPPESLQDFILDKDRRIIDLQPLEIAGEPLRVRLAAEFLQDFKEAVARRGFRRLRLLCGWALRPVAQDRIDIAELDGAAGIPVQADAQTCKFKFRRGDPRPE